MADVNFMQDDISDEMIAQLAKIAGSSEEVKQANNLFTGQDMTKLLEAYMEEEIPEQFRNEDILKQFWAVLGRTVKLTFITKEDLQEYEDLFEMAKNDFIMSIPPYEYSFKHQQMLEQLRIYFISALRRSMGTGNHVFNERILLGGQINQVIRSNTENFKPAGGGGVMGKLRGWFN